MHTLRDGYNRDVYSALKYRQRAGVYIRAYKATWKVTRSTSRYAIFSPCTPVADGLLSESPGASDCLFVGGVNDEQAAAITSAIEPCTVCHNR